MTRKFSIKRTLLLGAIALTTSGVMMAVTAETSFAQESAVPEGRQFSSKAGEQVLAHKLQDSVTAGSQQNIVQDLLEGQRPWEENADIRLHARIFAAALLLYKALPKSFPKPDMMYLALQLQARTEAAKRLLAEPPEAAFVTRVLADGMDEHSILERLFDEQLVARQFPEAEGIIWLAEFSELSADGASATLTVYSSQHWLHDLEAVEEFESSAYNDGDEEDDDD